MHALRMLHKGLSEGLPEIHGARLRALMAAVEGLVKGGSLWLSELGRHLPGRAKEKHKIKRIDRLLGNVHLDGERRQLYGWLARQLIGGCRHPNLIVDWSDVDAARSLFILRAAVSVGGRALPVYEEVHTRSQHPADERQFLEHLAALLPVGCQPVIVTDAGFRGPWFHAVTAHGWFYVGRVRNRNLVRFAAQTQWFAVNELYQQASSTPRALGTVSLNRSAPWATQAYLFRKRSQGRHRLTVHGLRRRNAQSEKHAKAEREPWLLVSNLPQRRNIAKQVVSIYRDRMSIEEAFRDLKAPRHGFAFRFNLGRNPTRVAILLLIAAFASFALWLVGLVGIQRRLDRGLQANTERRRHVLSVMFIGKRLTQQRLTIKNSDLRHALKSLQHDVQLRATNVA